MDRDYSRWFASSPVAEVRVRPVESWVTNGLSLHYSEAPQLPDHLTVNFSRPNN